MKRILLAEAMGRSPASSDFRDMIVSANKYGVIKGNYNSDTIELTPLGEQYTKPRSEEERLDAERTAIRRIPIFDQILQHFNNNRIPAADYLKNTLERDPFNVGTEWSGEVAEIFLASGKAAGLVRTVSGSLWVMMDSGPASVDEEPPAAASTAAPPEPKVEEPIGEALPPAAILQTKVAPAPAAELHAAPPTAQRQFFIGHGRNRKPVDQLQKILKGLDIPYVVAEEEPNAGRPIPEKVAGLMKSCNAGIFIFSADEEFQDREGNTVLRPRENVVYELGAASLLYGRRIVVFKEKGIAFPTDFRDLGYIEFDKDNLEGKSVDLLRELVALKAVRILPGS